ncbi:hypothetical protein DL240_16925 [Lujinxingia litoralis]|uniref:Lipoyl-binding domain-containing protein n=1 Tax=Lujinxingia litoralis TaxID=2211119 RepID=A0A328C1J1_9DELT|nr:NeuD/PglB/VioB family sugar acetyltransferase [Lujinxingia litoralis]RAL20488.1 hypothetical protein DL240_16925 [Lujinxingia litoralis]
MEWVYIPMLNANEDEAEVVDVLVEEGQKVSRGDVLCTLESTKATADVEAPSAGYVRALAFSSGQRARVGQPLCALTETMEEAVHVSSPQVPPAPVDDLPRATRRAAALASEYDVDLRAIPHQGILTERDILAHLGESPGALRAPGDQATATPAVEVGAGGQAIVIYGAGGHARVVIDMVREGRRDLRIVGIVDDSPDRPSEVLGVPVLGDASTFAELRERGVRLAALGVGAVTHNALRAELFSRLRREGFILPNLIHPRACVEPSVLMGQGNQIFAGAVVSSCVSLGDNTVINSNVVVSHDCVIDDHVHLTPGALLAGGVQVGARSVIGMGVTIFLGVQVGADVVIGNGSHILTDVADQQVIRPSLS